MPLQAVGTQKFLANYVIFREGDSGDVAYVIHSGKVRLSRKVNGKEEMVAEMGPGAVFGELALIDNSKRAATATTAAETVCSTIDKAYIQQKIKEADKVVQVLFKLMLNIIRNYPKSE